MHVPDENDDIRDEFYSNLRRTNGLWEEVWGDETEESLDTSPRDLIPSPEQVGEDEADLEAHLRRIGALALEAYQRGDGFDRQDVSSEESTSAPSEDGDDTPVLSEGHDDTTETEDETVKVTPEHREQLERALESGGIDEPDDERRHETDESTRALREIRERLEDGAFELDDENDMRRELNLLSNFFSDCRKHLKVVEDEASKSILEQVVARCRRLQEVSIRRKPIWSNDTCSEFLDDVDDFLDGNSPGYIRGFDKNQPLKSDWTVDVRHHLENFDKYLVDYFGEHPVYEESEIDEEELLTDVEQTVLSPDCESSELREVVYRVLEQGLDSDNPRLLNLLETRTDLVRLAELEWLLEQRDSEKSEETEETRFDSLQEALGVADETFEVLCILKKARESAAKSESEHTDKVYRALEAIAEVGETYFETKARGESMGGSWSMKLEEHGLKHAPSECQVTSSMYEEQRTFNGRKMERHVTLGRGGRNCVQIYFKLDEDDDRILIGHCGDHLDHYQGD